MSPKKVRICPGCPNNDLNLDVTPKFKFVNKIPNETTKIVTLLNNTKNKISKMKSLF